MFYLTSQKVKFALNTVLAALLAAAAIFLTTYDFNAAEWFNRILEGESFSAMILKAFVGGNADNDFFFGNIGLAMAIIAACYVGYLAGIFLDDYKTAIGVILTILCVMGIIGLFALKSLLLFSALVTDGYKFNGVGMIWTFEFFETLVIVITAVVSCFRRGLRRYSLFILAYFLGVFVCFIWLFLGFGLCVGLCVAVGVCRGDEDYGSFATSYSSASYSSSSSRSSGSYSMSNSDDDAFKEYRLDDGGFCGCDAYESNDDYDSSDSGDYFSPVTSAVYYDGDGNSLGYSIEDRYYDNDGSCVGYDVGDNHYDSDGNSTGYRVGDTEYDSDGNSVGYWVDDTFYEN